MTHRNSKFMKWYDTNILKLSIFLICHAFSRSKRHWSKRHWKIYIRGIYFFYYFKYIYFCKLNLNLYPLFFKSINFWYLKLHWTIALILHEGVTCYVNFFIPYFWICFFEKNYSLNRIGICVFFTCVKLDYCFTFERRKM